MTERNRPRVTNEFQDIGSQRARGTPEDIRSLETRVLDRLKASMGSDRFVAELQPGITSYNAGNYNQAFLQFTKLSGLPAVVEFLIPHVSTCTRVLKAKRSHEDSEYEVHVRDWERASVPRRLLGGILGMIKKPSLQIRCKHCAHYNPVWFMYHGTNSLMSDPLECLICHRDLPLPDFIWDSVDGQAYLYYAHLPADYIFYKEFERSFIVDPVVRDTGSGWILEPARDGGQSGRPTRSGIDPEGWGYDLGQRWRDRLKVAELEDLVEALVADDVTLPRFPGQFAS